MKNKSWIKTALIVLILACVIGVIIFLIPRFNTSDKPADTAATPSKRSSLNHTLPVQADSEEQIIDLPYPEDHFVTGVERLPKSLQGTQVDGEIIVTKEGQLVATPGLRRLFDYFLSALGEEDSATIDARVEAYISSRTPQPAADAAIDTYYQYQQYLKQVAVLESRLTNQQQAAKTLGAMQAGEVDLTRIKQQRQQVQALRQQILGKPVAQAFFAADDQVQDYNMAMLQIAQDKSLSIAQKQQAQQAYIQKLPESATKQQLQQQKQIEQLIEQAQQMKQQGASEKQIFEMRAKLVGPQAAQRLGALDKKNQDFDHRFTQYQQRKQQILATNSSNNNKQQQITQLEQQLFSETEQKRLVGYEAYRAYLDDGQQP